MSVQMSLRVDPNLKAHLAKLAELRKMTVNKLIVQALDQFVTKESHALEAELEASLAQLRQYRAADPDFEQAIEAVVAAERPTEEDPAQGELLTDEPQEATSLVRGLLSA